MEQIKTGEVFLYGIIQLDKKNHMKIQDRDIGTQRRTNNTAKEVRTKIKPHK